VPGSIPVGLTKAQTADLVRQAYATYNQTITLADEKFVFRAWYDLLWDLAYEDVKMAFLELATYEKFMPRPGDIRRHTIDTTTKVPSHLDAYSSWGIFQGIVKSVNSGVQTNIHKPEALLKTLQQLGDAAYGMHTNGDREVFVKVYEEIVSQLEKTKYTITTPPAE